LKGYLVKSSIRYLRLFFGFVLSILLLFGAFNWYVDPFEIYWTGKYEPHREVFMKKPWIFKAMNVRKILPKSIIMGSSRTGLGIDPEHPAGDQSIYPRYNLGLPGSNMYEILSYVEHSHELSGIKQVIVGIDFYSFNIFYRANTEFNESLLHTEGSSKLFSYFRDTMTALFTWSSFKLSKRKLKWDKKDISYLNGFTAYTWSPRWPPGKSFLHNQKNYSTIFLHPAPRYQFCLYDENGNNPQMQALKELLQLAIRKQIDIRLFINPIHASLQQIIKYSNLWPTFEDWKRNLVRIVSDQNSDQTQEVKLWDFSGYNSFTIEEETPSESLIRTMKWYYEALHYSKELGELMLDRIYDYKDESRVIPDDFGILLSEKNIDDHLKRIRKQQIKYEQLHVKENEIWAQRIEEIKMKRRFSDCHMGSGA
jgi:hypothetical protein